MNELTKQTVVFLNKEYTIATMTSSKGKFGFIPQSLEDVFLETDFTNLPVHDRNKAKQIDSLYDYVVNDDIINNDDTTELVLICCDEGLLDE